MKLLTAGAAAPSISACAPNVARAALGSGGFGVNTHAAVDGVVLSTTTCVGVLVNGFWAILSHESSLSVESLLSNKSSLSDNSSLSF